MKPKCTYYLTLLIVASALLLFVGNNSLTIAAHGDKTKGNLSRLIKSLQAQVLKMGKDIKKLKGKVNDQTKQIEVLKKTTIPGNTKKADDNTKKINHLTKTQKTQGKSMTSLTTKHEHLVQNNTGGRIWKLERKTSGFNAPGNRFIGDLYYRGNIIFESAPRKLIFDRGHGFIQTAGNLDVHLGNNASIHAANGHIVANKNLISETGDLKVPNNQWGSNKTSVSVLVSHSTQARNCPQGMFVYGIKVERGTCDNKCKATEAPVRNITLLCASL